LRILDRPDDDAHSIFRWTELALHLPPMESMNENSAAPCIFHRLIPPWRFPVCGKYAGLISAEFSRELSRRRVGVVALNDFCFADGRRNSLRGAAAQSSRVSRFMRVSVSVSLQQRRFFAGADSPRGSLSARERRSTEIHYFAGTNAEFRRGRARRIPR